MNPEAMAAQLAAVEARCKSNSRRLDTLESDQKAVMELALSVKEMATEQSGMKTDMAEVKSDVKELKSASGKRWDALVEKCVWLVFGGMLTFILAQIGLP